MPPTVPSEQAPEPFSLWVYVAVFFAAIVIARLFLRIGERDFNARLNGEWPPRGKLPELGKYNGVEVSKSFPKSLSKDFDESFDTALQRAKRDGGNVTMHPDDLALGRALGWGSAAWQQEPRSTVKPQGSQQENDDPHAVV